MRKVGLILGLAIVASSCGVGEAQTEVTCQSEYAVRDDERGQTRTHIWAEFDVNPGRTEVTVCYPGNSEAEDPVARLDRCSRGKAPWFVGTNRGYVDCGVLIDNDVGPDIPATDIISITVHN